LLTVPFLALAPGDAAAAALIVVITGSTSRFCWISLIRPFCSSGLTRGLQHGNQFASAHHFLAQSLDALREIGGDDRHDVVFRHLLAFHQNRRLRRIARRQDSRRQKPSSGATRAGISTTRRRRLAIAR